MKFKYKDLSFQELEHLQNINKTSYYNDDEIHKKLEYLINMS